MKYSHSFNNIFLYSFFILSIGVGYFIKLQHQKLVTDYNAAIQQQDKLRQLLQASEDLEGKMNLAQRQHQQANMQGFFNKPNHRRIKQAIDVLGKKCHIHNIMIEFEAVKYDQKIFSRLPVKISFQTDLDSDVFQFIDLLNQQQIGTVDITEFNIFREDGDVLLNQTLKAEIHIEIITHHTPNNP